MEFVARIGESDKQVSVDALEDGRYKVTINGVARVLDARRVDGTAWLLDTGDGRVIRADVEGNKEGDAIVDLAGVATTIKLLDPRRLRLEQAQAAASKGRGATGPELVRTPMPGKVVKLLVKVGDTVTSGQGVAVVEAMKMENELRCSRDGKVVAVHVSEGQALEGQAQIVSIE
jgi:biotin carboxyl carrier protein